MAGLWNKIKQTNIYKSIYRNDYPTTPRNQVLVILNSVALHLHPVKIPKSGVKVTYTWGLGGTSLLMFLLLTVTGVILMFYYIPSTAMGQAYFSVKNLETGPLFGMYMRNLHRWTAHGMVLIVFLHMCRVFYTGSYKRPREFNWALGVVLLTVTFLLSFTGYLLPWDQLAFWAITVGTNMAGATPPREIVGKYVRFALLGGFEIGQATLIRWYTLHVIFLPLAAIVLMAVHFWRVRKDGGISTPIHEEDDNA